MKKIVAWFGGRYYAIAVLTVFLAAAVLRLYRISEFATFLGDQGRDAIIMKSIGTFSDFTALGPITSVGSIYLGPLYYYLMAPWLMLFGLDPVGPAYGVAIFGLIAIVLQYLAVKDLTDRLTALISIILTSCAWVLVEYQRFSWNPNLLPPVSFFAVYTAIKAAQTHKLKWYVLLGALLSVAVQLHYLAAILLPTCGMVLIAGLMFEKKKRWSAFFIGITGAFFSFCALLAPFILFEIKHSFPNTMSMLRFSGENSAKNTSNPVTEMFDTAHHLFSFVFQIKEVGLYGGAIILSLLCLPIIIPYLTAKKRISLLDRPIVILAFSSLLLLFGTSFYNGPKYPHYLGALYIFMYVQTAYLLSMVIRYTPKYIGVAITTIVIAAFIYSNGSHFLFLWQADGPRQIDRARDVAKVIVSMNPRDPFSFTMSPQAYADYPYRYFLDAMGHKPVGKEEDSTIVTKDLVVICETKCDPTKDPQWAIAHFSPQRTSGEKTASGIYIYKLTK